MFKQGLGFAALVFLGACSSSGPLISDRHLPDTATSPARFPSSSVNGISSHGMYCLAQTVLIVDVVPVAAPAGPPQPGGGHTASGGAGDPSGAPSPVGDANITITSQVVPDFQYTYYLGYNESLFSDDDVQVEYADNSCILKKIETHTEDRTREVVDTVLKTVITAATGVPVQTGQTKGVGPAPSQRPLHLVLRPDDPRNDDNPWQTAQDILNSALKKGHYSFQIRIRPLLDGTGAGTVPMRATPPDRQYRPQQASVYNPDDAEAPMEGIFYRTPMPYLVELCTDQCSKADTEGGLEGNVVSQTVIYTEAGRPIDLLPIRRSSFVKRETTVAFTNGFPSSIETKKPSEAEAFVQIPLDIVSAIVAVPGQLLTFHINQTQDQGTLLKNQEAIIQNQEDLLKKQAEMRTYLSSPTP